MRSRAVNGYIGKPLCLFCWYFTSERRESVVSPGGSGGQEVAECKARNEGLTHRHNVYVLCSEGFREDAE